METSATITKIAESLLKAQLEMGDAKKDSTNPFFKSKYADLNSVREACIPVLNRHGIVAIQPFVNKDGKNFVNTVLLHESGEFISSLTEIVYSKTNDAQAQGSGITYARRYGLQSIVNIGSEDDDGAKASQEQKAPEQKKSETKTPVKKTPTPTPKTDLLEGTDEFKKARQFILDGGSVDRLEVRYNISYEVSQLLIARP